MDLNAVTVQALMGRRGGGGGGGGGGGRKEGTGEWAGCLVIARPLACGPAQDIDE